MMFEYAKYKKMIFKAAWCWAKKYQQIPVEDFISQGNLIFVEAIESFDASKNCTFSTHLTTQLMRLNDMIDFDRRRWGKVSSAEFDEFTSLPSPELSKGSEDILEKAAEILDEDSLSVLKYLISFEWHNPKAAKQFKPSKNSLLPIFRKNNNWSTSRFIQAWEELKEFWGASALELNSL